MRRPISDRYLDSEGNEQVRASSEDFETLPTRHMQAVENVPGFEQDGEVIQWMSRAVSHYERGDYAQASQYMTWSLNRIPDFESHLFYYLRICNRVLSIPLTAEEEKYKAKLERYRRLPKWLKWFMPRLEIRMRCKYCGRYVPYVHPDTPTFGFDRTANSCRVCGRMYHMPSWMWDSSEGRAYSYYRGSFEGEDFYEEFEADYDPMPRCPRRH